MRTITFNIFQYDELSADTKKKALENMRERIGSMLCDFNADDYRGALNEIEKIFEIRVYDWCVGYPGTYCRWRFKENSRFYELSEEPRYLLRYLDEIERYCGKGRYYSTPFKKCEKSAEHPAGITNKVRYSKVLFERNCCLTGDWTSAVVDDYMKKRWDYVRKGKTIYDFVDDMLYDFFKRWERDREYNYEDEAIEETIIGNEYEFTEDGRQYSA